MFNEFSDITVGFLEESYPWRHIITPISTSSTKSMHCGQKLVQHVLLLHKKVSNKCTQKSMQLSGCSAQWYHEINNLICTFGI